MNIKITPTSLSGTVAAIPSKSHMHRLLIANALSGIIKEENFSDIVSADIIATKNCLQQLYSKNTLPILDCNESGSTLRFLLPVAAALCDEAIFGGRGRLPTRPLFPLKEEMEAHGCHFDFKIEGAICKISGRLQCGIYTLPGNISSQFITGLLFALPLLNGDSQIILTSKLESAGYVDLTLQVLEQYGIQIEKTDHPFPAYYIPHGQQYRAPANIETTAEGDWSNSAFWLAAEALNRQRNTASTTKSKVICTGLDPTSTQGDKEIINLLNLLAADTDYREIDASDIPDLIPILSVVASTAKGITVVKNAARLRLKESDRLKATADLLSGLGADIEELDAGLMIRGQQALAGGIANGYNDHRIVMSAAIASAKCKEPVIIKDAEAVNKSYPHFFDEFVKLGGKIDVL